MSQRFAADQPLVGQRIDQAVALRCDMSRSRAQQLVGSGHVRVDGHAVAKSHRLTDGEMVTVEEPPPMLTDAGASQAELPAVGVRYEDEHLVVVAKPAGLVVHAGAGNSGGTLVDVLRAMGVPLAAADDPARPGIVHRLDRGTSGLLIVAKTQTARSRLMQMFKRHDVERRYWALVDGVPNPASATVDAPIARDGTRRTRFTVDQSGRPAVTHYDVEDALGVAARLTVRLETGRTHQVRVHLAAVGHPVSGDAAYGADAALARDLSLERPALHAAHLAFTHPVTGRRLTLSEPLPDDLRHAWATLRGRWAAG